VKKKSTEKNYYNGFRDFLTIQNKLCPYMMPSSVKVNVDIDNFKKVNRVARNTSYYIYAFARALKMNPRVNAGFIRSGLIFKRPTIVSYEQVNAGVSIDREIGEERFPITYVVEDAHRKTVQEIDKELDYAINKPLEEVPQFKSFLILSKMPRFLRKFFMTMTTLSKNKLAKRVGTFSLTNVSGFDFEAAYAPCPRLLVATGRPKDGLLPLTYNFNHIICDGFQIGKFHKDFVKIFGEIK